MNKSTSNYKLLLLNFKSSEYWLEYWAMPTTDKFKLFSSFMWIIIEFRSSCQSAENNGMLRCGRMPTYPNHSQLAKNDPNSIQTDQMCANGLGKIYVA